MIVDGFNLESPFVCEGIVGDGCGGGRIFFVKDESLFAYDPMSKVSIVLLKEIKNIQSINKKACKIFIHTMQGIEEFDLSKIKS